VRETVRRDVVEVEHPRVARKAEAKVALLPSPRDADGEHKEADRSAPRSGARND
jgi:hypothetical protein